MNAPAGIERRAFVVDRKLVDLIAGGQARQQAVQHARVAGGMNGLADDKHAFGHRSPEICKATTPCRLQQAEARGSCDAAFLPRGYDPEPTVYRSVPRWP